MPYVEVEGKQFFYAGDHRAEGTPVIFCHGSGGGHHHWLYQLKGLKGGVNPLAVDLPGHGRSEGEPAADIAVYRDWLRLFARALNLSPFVAAGHSMGGAIALDYALNYPEDITGLILVGSGGRLRVLPAFLETLQKGVVPAALADFLYCSDAPQEMLQKGREEVASTAASIYHADLSACDKFDVTDELERINRPVIMICGSEDRLTPVKYSHFLAEKLPSGKVEAIDGAGHMVMIEKPEAVNRAIETFIAGLQ